MTKHDTATTLPDPEDRHSARTLVPWPPPGLERLHGDLWRITVKLAVGGAVLVLPLLWATASRPELAGTGPYRDAWWVPLLSALVGLAVLTAAFVDGVRLLRRMGSAARSGYHPRLVALVAADQGRDAGFLLQGARAYSELSLDTRRALRLVRVMSALLYALGSLWLSLGFAVGLILAARGVLSPRGLVAFTLAPSALLLALGLFGRTWDGRMMRAARKRWYNQPWAVDLAGSDVRDWQEQARLRSDVELPPASARHGRAFRIATAGAILAAFLVVLPVISLVVMSGVSPALAVIGVPRFSQTQQRAAAVEPLRRYVLPADETVSPEEAGELLQVLAYVGSDREPETLERPPVRRYEQPWLDEGDNPLGLHPGQWADSLLPQVRRASPEVRRYLAGIAAHPAHPEFARLARAGAMDPAGGRWRMPLPDTLSLLALPFPHLSGLRAGAHAQIARAAYEFGQGRTAQAEQTLRETISVGFLLLDEGQSLIENLIGLILVEHGAAALAQLYRASGSGERAEEMEWARSAARRAAERVQGSTPDPDRPADALAMLRGMPEVVLDSAALTGMRWEYLLLLNTLAPCVNLNRAVFGPGREYEEWIERARQRLVQYPSEAEIFELGRWGFYGRSGPAREPSWYARALNLAMGGHDAPGSCASMLDAVGPGF